MSICLHGKKPYEDCLLCDKRPAVRGLHISVLRDASHNGDCTNNGVSAQHTTLTLVGEGINGPFEPSPDAPAVKLVKRNLPGRSGQRIEYLHLEPVDAGYNGGRWLMAGGNFGWTSDSRFPSDYPISIHDRFEG
jgi:hypothetical protein